MNKVRWATFRPTGVKQDEDRTIAFSFPAENLCDLEMYVALVDVCQKLLAV